MGGGGGGCSGVVDTLSCHDMCIIIISIMIVYQRVFKLWSGHEIGLVTIKRKLLRKNERKSCR